MFGKTEREIIGSLEKRKKANVREIHTDLKERGLDLAYTTISTILERLHKKGVVGRVSEPYKGGDRYLYLYKDIEDDYIDSLLGGIVTVLGKKGVVHLAQRLEGITEEDLEKVRKRLKL